MGTVNFNSICGDSTHRNSLQPTPLIPTAGLQLGTCPRAWRSQESWLHDIREMARLSKPVCINLQTGAGLKSSEGHTEAERHPVVSDRGGIWEQSSLLG